MVTQQVAGFFRDVHVIMSCLTVDGNQKSGHHSPPGMVLKPVGKSWDEPTTNLPQLVSGNRISGCHQKYVAGGLEKKQGSNKITLTVDAGNTI